MAKRVALTVEQIIAALAESGGRVYLAASKLGVSPKAVYKRAENSPEIAEAIETNKGRRLDEAEDKLWEAVKDREPWAVCFFLKTQGKARGYVEKSEVEHSGATTLQIVEEIVGDHRPAAGPTAPHPAGVPAE